MLWSAPACDLDEAAQGEAAQQRVSLTPTADAKLPSTQTPPKIPTEQTPPKIDLSQEETQEQRLRRLENEGRRDRCLELLEAALGATRTEYRESDCTLKFKKSADSYILANLNRADATVKGGKLIFSCRDPKSTSNCVGSSSPVQTNTVGWQISPDADGAELQRCLDFLHERCKEM